MRNCLCNISTYCIALLLHPAMKHLIPRRPLDSIWTSSATMLVTSVKLRSHDHLLLVKKLKKTSSSD